MKFKISMLLFAFICLFLFSTNASSITIDFENQYNLNPLIFRNRVLWDGTIFTYSDNHDRTLRDNWQWMVWTDSGGGHIYTPDSDSQAIFFWTPTYLNSFEITAQVVPTNLLGAGIIDIYAYNSLDVLIWESEVDLNPTWGDWSKWLTVEVETPGVDHIVFGGAYYSIDNMVYGEIPTPVPEPSTIYLIGTALFGMFAFGRKKLFKCSHC